MGGSVEKVFSSTSKFIGETVQRQGELAMDPLNYEKAKASVEDAGAAVSFITDPGGLFHKNTNKSLFEAQQEIDGGGYGARLTKEEEVAQEEAAKQEALIKKQQDLTDAERAKQDSVADERRTRMKQHQLLTAGETGTASLLG